MNNMNYCAINQKLGKFVIGETKAEIVNQVFTWEFDEQGRISAKTQGYKAIKLHSYTSEWTEEEKRKDAAQTLFYKLESVGWKWFTSIDNWKH